MIRSLKAVTVFSSALMIGIFLGATSQVSRASTDSILGVTGQPAQRQSQSPAPPLDPKRKKPGEACKSPDECQRHHTCAKVGDQNICQAPPSHSLPPGAVT
jgi:hypothetical protein